MFFILVVVPNNWIKFINLLSDCVQSTEYIGQKQVMKVAYKTLIQWALNICFYLAESTASRSFVKVE